MNTNLVSSVPGATASNWEIILFLMVLGCLIGTVALWCFQRVLSGEKTEDKWEMLKILGMGVGAVALVPVFLRMISSSLLKEAEANIEARFVFLGFCVAAAVTARRFLSVVPQKLLDTVASAQRNATEAKKQADEAQERVTSVGNAVADRTSVELQPPPEEILKTMRSGSISAYDWKALRLIRAFLNPKFPKSRTTTGLAFDSGLTVVETLKYLEQLEKNGDVVQFLGDSKKGTWWALTAEGRQKFSCLRPQLDKLNLVDTDVP